MTKKKFFYLILIVLFPFFTSAQDTFSIIAVDTITGEIGGAGASCIDESSIQGGVLIINDIIPARGGIHTQSYWNATNQQNAHNRMMEGLSPQEIIDWLITHDAQNNPGIRQYGIVDFDPSGNPRSAGFTGASCFNYKNHVLGRNYAIQGNILLGQQILDSMEARFLNTEGTLAEKLMAALQGAKVPGADTRCLDEGTSSLSAFIRVVQPDNTPGNFWCDLLVPSVPYGVEPIDSLQVLFDQWVIWTSVKGEKFVQPNRAHVFPNPANSEIRFEIPKKADVQQLSLQLLTINGELITEFQYKDQPVVVNTSGYSSGIYLFKVFGDSRLLDSGKFTISK
jgi:uncharacterized Ntn-hydrolase superfamily protein